jgi:molecular chaperone GrpE
MPKHQPNPATSPGPDDLAPDEPNEEAVDLTDAAERDAALSPEEELEAYARSLEEKQRDGGESDDELAERVRELESDLEGSLTARMRLQADYQNYQRRALENESRAVRDGAGRVLRDLLPVLDHFDLALNQPTEQVSVAQLMDGVRMVRDELAKALEQHELSAIAPNVGDEFDPSLHQAVARQPSDEWPPNTIVAVLQVGYALGDVVLRPCTVAVAGPAEDE